MVDEMTKEIKRTLLLITGQPPSQGTSGVSTTYLLEHLDIGHQRLLEIVEMLEQAGYIQVKQHGRVTLITPTLQGHEKAAFWKEKEREKPWFQMISTTVKVVGGGLIAALLGLLWWWLGLSPQTTDLQPVIAAIPIRLYDTGTTPTVERLPWSWFRFASAPAPNQTINAKDWDEVEALFTEDVPISFDGLVHFRFDIENVGVNYQVNINSVLIEVTSQPVDDPENLFFYQPALGGGEIQQYQLDLSALSANRPQGESQTYKAVLRSGNNPVDYIYVKPGERESIEISVNLGTPGNYTLTPVINYAFREESPSVRADSYHVLYPHRYRVWAWDQKSTTSGENHPILTRNIIADTQSDQIQISGTLSQSATNCLSSTRWIAFESSMLDEGSLKRLFLIDTGGQNLRMIGSHDTHGVIRYLEWLSAGKLLIGEPILKKDLPDYTYEMRSFDLSTGQTSIVEAKTPNSMKHWYDVAWNQVCLKDGETCLSARPVAGTNIENIYLERNGILRPLVPSSKESQGYLDLSPDENSLVFVQGESWSQSCDNRRIYIVHPDGTGLEQVTDRPGCYANPAWSPDGRYIAFENDGDIYLHDLRTRDEKHLTNSSWKDQGPSWSDDAQWIVSGGERLSLSNWDGSCTQNVLIPPIGEISNVLMQPSSTVPAPVPHPMPTIYPTTPVSRPTNPTESPYKLEFIAYGGVVCGGISPVPGCVYTLQEWIGAQGPITPGEPIKVLIMHPRSAGAPDIDSCQGYQIDDAAYTWSDTPVRIRVRGEPCDWSPDYLFCVCDQEDFVRLEPNH